MALTIPSQFSGTVAFALNKQEQPEIEKITPKLSRLGQGKTKLK